MEKCLQGACVKIPGHVPPSRNFLVPLAFSNATHESHLLQSPSSIIDEVAEDVAIELHVGMLASWLRTECHACLIRTPGQGG